MNQLLISIIVPTYNEEHGINEFYDRTKKTLAAIAHRFNYEIIFINDYSSDKTYLKLTEIANQDKNVKLVSFSRNFGNQIAIAAGLDIAKGDLVVIIDDDLQDPPELIPTLIDKWDEGYKVVYGVRPKRDGINPIFNNLANFFYFLMSLLSETHIPKYTGDFRLMDRAVVNVLKSMNEENRFYRGMVAWVGFSQIGVEYERDKRYAGKSTFSIKKYFNFAVNGFTSFTERPLYLSSLLGAIITGISFIFLGLLVYKKIIDPLFSIPGWPSLIAIILFFGGIQLLSIGVVSIYISKIYREVKKRPLYIIESTQNLE